MIAMASEEVYEQLARCYADGSYTFAEGKLKPEFLSKPRRRLSSDNNTLSM